SRRWRSCASTTSSPATARAGRRRTSSPGCSRTRSSRAAWGRPCASELRGALPGVREDLARGVAAGEAGDVAARMRARAAEIQPLDRHAVAGGPEQRAPREPLVQARLAMQHMAGRESEVTFEVDGREDLTRHDQVLEPRR